MGIVSLNSSTECLLKIGTITSLGSSHLRFISPTICHALSKVLISADGPRPHLAAKISGPDNPLTLYIVKS